MTSWYPGSHHGPDGTEEQEELGVNLVSSTMLQRLGEAEKHQGSRCLCIGSQESRHTGTSGRMTVATVLTGWQQRTCDYNLHTGVNRPTLIGRPFQRKRSGAVSSRLQRTLSHTKQLCEWASAGAARSVVELKQSKGSGTQTATVI